MTKKTNRPKVIDPTIITILSDQVKPGSFRQFPSSNLPNDIPSAGENSQAIVIAADEIYSSDVPHLPSEMSPYALSFY